MDNNKVTWRIGKRLDGRYEIQSVLGIGGMAVVYKAFDQKLGRNVAIKVLRDDAAMDTESRRRFHKEYQAVAMLSHPNIRAVYDVVSSGDTEYIVMEYVDGINLKQYVKKKGHLSWKEALHFSAQIARALSHAHAKGIVHLDIKPQNIMLLRDGTAKVADFGIAQFEGAADNDGSEALGSIHYISPEQARGEPVDSRSDIYSLGVVMYEMLTGKLPFDGESVAEVAVKHFTVVPEAPTALVPDIPPELEEITLLAMQPNPDERYASVEDMLHDLEDFRKGQTAAIGEEVQRALAAESMRRRARRDEVHVVTKNVPRISRAGELSREGYDRRRARAARISALTGFGLVIVFALAMFAFVWNYWLKGIFSDAERMSVPSFVGESAEAIVGDADMAELFDFHITYKADAEHPEGEIISQDPSAGASRMIVPEGIDVELIVSSGVKLVTLGDYTNQMYTEAQIALQEQGLNVEVALQASDTITKNYIVGMNPEPGSSLSTGSLVTLYVSAGPSVTYTTVPDVTGMEKSDALYALQQKGLICTEAEITYVSSTPENDGKVLWQNYGSGSSVISGTKVYIQIGADSNGG